MDAPTAQILDTVATFIREVMGEDLEPDEEIALETSFNEDLELESIEFVALGELLQNHYGERVDFVGWLSDKELDAIIRLTVGELVEFIGTCR